MKNKSLNLIVGLLMVVALGGALLLVKQNQNTERGAYFAGTSLLMQPEAVTGNVGGDVLVQLFAETEKVGTAEGDYAKISSLDTVVCFGSNLKITDLATQVMLNEEVLKTKIDASAVTVDGKSCLRLIAISDTAAKPEDLKGGMVKLATIKFKGESAGTGSVEFLTDRTKIGGYNPTKDATDMALKVGTVTGATYTIGTGTTGCNLTADPPRNCPEGFFCFTESDESGADGICKPNPTNTPTPVVTTGDEPILNFGISFGNVKAGDAKCVVDWPLQIIVLSGGETKVYKDLKAELIESTGKLNVYKGSLPLVGFNHLTNVAVFVKGPKHLQMKYAIQNQSGPYDEAGGKLTLTKSAETSPLYDFTAYPMLAGDVVGATVDSAPNGEINGVDYAYVKSKAIIFEDKDLKGDLDGNCQVNSNDVFVLKVSLEKKQGELY